MTAHVLRRGFVHEHRREETGSPVTVGFGLTAVFLLSIPAAYISVHIAEALWISTVVLRYPAAQAGRPDQLAVDRADLARDVGPVEREHVLAGLGHEAVAQLRSVSRRSAIVASEPGSRERKRRPTSLVRHDLAQAAGVGDQARAAGGHRLERHQPERLVDRRHHGQVGDPVERVQHVVADPAQERAVVVEAELGRLLAQLLLVRCPSRRPGSARRPPARSGRAAPRARAGSPSRRRAARPAARASRPAGRSARAACRRSSTGTSSEGSMPFGITATRSSSSP